LYAGIHAKIWGYYRLLSQQFPHAVYYSVEDDAVQVTNTTIVHCANVDDASTKGLRSHQ